jgi:hypothetical protein
MFRRNAEIQHCSERSRGFGFAVGLANAGLPRKDLPLTLPSFNVGVAS